MASVFNHAESVFKKRYAKLKGKFRVCKRFTPFFLVEVAIFHV